MTNRNTTKRAPPRAKGTTKSNSGSRNGKPTKKAVQSKKRAATAESEHEEESRSDDEPTSKAPSRKRARVEKSDNESEEEAEYVDDINPAPTPEVISDDEEANSANENEVSKKIRIGSKFTSLINRGMALTSINAGQFL